MTARQLWPAVAAWAVGAALLGALVGPLASVVQTATDTDPRIGGILRALARTQGGSTALLSGLVMSFAGLLAAAAAVQSVLRLRQEEAEGRAELLLAAPIGRIRAAGTALLAGAIAATAVLAAGAVAAAAGLHGDGAAARARARPGGGAASSGARLRGRRGAARGHGGRAPRSAWRGPPTGSRS